MPESPLAKKLQIKPHTKVLVLNAPDGYVARLSPVPQGVAIAQRAHGQFDVVHLFVREKKELMREAPKAIKSVRDGGILWISYPKKSAATKTDLSRDVGWEPVSKAGWDGIALVAVDDTWSAMRFKRAHDGVKPRADAHHPKFEFDSPRDKYEFDIVLAGGESGSVCYFAFPGSVLETFRTRARVPVKGTINGAAFRSSLSPMGGGTHVMPVNRALQSAASCGPGDKVHIVLERDTGPREIEPPADLKAALAKNKAARAAWDAFAFTHKREYAEWIENAKKPETRARRLLQAVEMIAKKEKRS